MAQAAVDLKQLETTVGASPEMTLLDLVAAVARRAASDAEVVSTVTRLINSGKVRLVGNFQGADVRVA